MSLERDISVLCPHTAAVQSPSVTAYLTPFSSVPFPSVTTILLSVCEFVHLLLQTVLVLFRLPYFLSIVLSGAIHAVMNGSISPSSAEQQSTV